MNKVMLNGEYMSIETAETISLLKRENKQLKEEIKHLKELYDDSFNSFEILFKRVNKAIDYIENKWKKSSYYVDVDNCLQFMTINEFDYEDLIEILKGE